MTRDVDIFFEPTKANAKRLLRALAATGYDGIEDVPLKTILSKKILIGAQGVCTRSRSAHCDEESGWAGQKIWKTYRCWRN